ncbi:MAG: cupin domain-containing protein [Myxococcales bacterium]|nr:cupin domain-containing protein [Myxococcales bacterium]
MRPFAVLPVIGAVVVACAGPPLPTPDVPKPDAARVNVAHVRLGERPLRVTVRACEELDVFALDGRATLRTEHVAATLESRDAFRFRGPGDVSLTGDGEAVIARVDASTVHCEARGEYGVLRPSTDRTATLAAGKLTVDFRADAPADANTALAASLETLTAEGGFVVPPHTHAGTAETLYIESGSGWMKLGADERRVAPGTVIHIPPDTVHDLRLDPGESLRAIQLYAPSGPEQRFKAAAPTPAPTDAAPPASADGQ